MPAYNFTVFLEEIEKGAKRQTIRAQRRRLTLPGDTLHLYTGQRTAQCRRLLPPQECRALVRIGMDLKKRRIWKRTMPRKYLTQNEIEELAQADGFECLDDFFEFFSCYDTFTLRYLMEIIHW